jgi:E3 ubiquitin-protein ligase HUWE1
MPQVFHQAPFMVGGAHRNALAGMSTRAASTLSAQLDNMTSGLENEISALADRLHALEEDFELHMRVLSGSANDSLDFRGYQFRPNRPGPPNANADDGLNPLLRRNNNNNNANTNPGPPRDAAPASVIPNIIRLGLPGSLLGGGLDGPMALINDLVSSLPASLARGGHPLSFQITQQGPRGETREVSIPLNATQPSAYTMRWDGRPQTYHEPQQVVGFVLAQTVERWQEEAKMVFGATYSEKAQRYHNIILSKLLPAALDLERAAKAAEAERKRKEEAERKEREEKARQEREAKEAEAKAAQEKEAKERELAEREAAEEAEREAAQEAAAIELSLAQPGEVAEDETAGDDINMEDEDDEDSDHDGDKASETQPPAADAPRVVTTIRGEEVDVTELGIDPEYLEALPEEFREEVIAQTVSARRTEARDNASGAPAGGENSEVFEEFLNALPDDLRSEIVQQERQERRRRERDEERRAATASGQAVGPQDMDPASILLTFPRALREQVLLDQGEDIMDQLPPDLAAEARALAQRHAPVSRMPARAERDADVENLLAHATRQYEDAQRATQHRPVVQMLDKAGVATLLRLMFITQHGSTRQYLFEVLYHVCENKQNRAEVISTVLQILQDGSTDMDAVERSFGQLSLKAKQPKDKEPKTPNSLKRTLTSVSSNGLPIQANAEVSPLLIVQQCLDLLVELAKNRHVPSLFLTEHDIVASMLKRTVSRKGKGKSVDAKASKFAINSLLALLDRKLVMDSSAVMQLLADLLNKITFPLQALRKKEANDAGGTAPKPEETQELTAAQAMDATPAAQSITGEAPAAPGAEQPAGGEAVQAPAAATQETAAANQPTEAGSSTAPPESRDEAKAPEAKKAKPMVPPAIPDHNLKLVINIFTARECSSKTFQNTISTIKNLSNIPNAKKVFGEELVRQARSLSQNIVTDLDDLLPHILSAESGTEIQGVALAKFSPGASEQNKLLRVLTALDHLFDGKNKSVGDASEEVKDDLVASLYYNETFGTMWDKLSACLSGIRQRENLISVATILLPLIESLMVVCKNITLSDAPMSQSQLGKDMLLSSPPPENRMAGLFFTFTEDHRRILNELVRHNPKLMSGTFSLLVKNPKVLEFDNKRNYFNRSVHSKNGQPQSRPAHPALQLSVRREHVFHDSFKSLYFKTGDEMKFGKLNIRFHGEEGVDAGGVTREWFQVLARQMFDPNYVLFIPVSSDRTTFHPNKLSAVNDEHLMFFKFIGRIIGKALYEGRLLDCYFSRAVYKRILGKPVSVKDMESFDPDYYKSLVWMLENDITDIITETFSVEDDEFGVTRIVDLIENGRNVPVTEENKHDYVRLVVEHKLLSSVKDQMENFLKGK